MTLEAAPDDPHPPEYCGCVNCESMLVAMLVGDASVSVAEAVRWLVAAQLAGHPRLRCAR